MPSDQLRSHARVRILYEDSRGPTNGFGLHKLVLATTHDMIAARGFAIQRHVLEKRVIAIPKRSDGKVMAAIRDDGEQLHAGHSALLAWLDDDKIHRTLNLAASTSRMAKLTAIRSFAPPSLEQRPGALGVFLVNGNIEAFLKTIDSARPNALSRATLEAALGKDRSARDQCFAEAAKQSHIEWRAAIRRRDSGFDCAIRYLACLSTHEPWPPW